MSIINVDDDGTEAFTAAIDSPAVLFARAAMIERVVAAGTIFADGALFQSATYQLPDQRSRQMPLISPFVEHPLLRPGIPDILHAQ